MVSVKGVFRDGVVHLQEAIEGHEGHEGQEVIVTFVERPAKVDDNSAAWDQLDRILEERQIDVDIPDLAHQHEHYFHGTPKTGSGWSE